MTTAAPKSPTSDRPAQRAAAPVVQSGVRIDPIRVLRQNQWKIVIAAMVGVGIGAAAKMVADRVYPLYAGTVLFELRAAVTNSSDSVATENRSEEAFERQALTEAGRLTSRQLLEKAMRNRDIEGTEWSKKYRDENDRFVVEEAVDDLEEQLSAGPRKRTSYIALTWQTHEQSDVPVVLNSIADTYIQIRKANDDERFGQNLSVFNSRLASLDSDLSNLGTEVGEFIQKRNITSLEKGATDINQQKDDTGKRINETKGQLSMATSRRDQTDAKLQGRMEPSNEDIRQADEDPVMMRINSTVKDVRVGAEIARQKFGANHPEYRNASRAVEAAELERDSELKKILTRNLNADLKLYSDQSESMARLLKEYQEDYAAQTVRLKEFAAGYADLQQLQDRQTRLQESRSKLLDLISELNSLKLREDARAVTIAQKAMTPREKSFPKWSIMLPLGGLLGLGLVIGIAFLRELFDQRVRYPSDLAGMAARLLGTVPDISDDPTGVTRIENAIREAPQSVVAESLRQMASHSQKHLRGHKTLLLIGALPGAGVTALLTNLAESMASSGKRVLVIDADLRRPTLSAAFGVDVNKPGLGDVLAGKTTLDKSITRVTDSIHLLGAGTTEHRIFERLATASTDTLLAEAKGLYDVVLIDTAPAIVAGDAMVLAGKVDASMMVVRAFQEHRGLVSRLVHQLNDMPSQFIGIVLNRPRNTAGGYFRKNYEAMVDYAGGDKSAPARSK